MRAIKIVLACALLMSWAAVAGAAESSQEHGKPSADGKVFKIEVENPLHQERVKHPDCLIYREEKYCKKLIKKRCRKWDRRCVEYDRSDRANPRCIRHERKCLMWSKERCREWGTRYVCEKWRGNTHCAPAEGGLNPARR